MRKIVYLDATIPSYLFDERESINAYIEVTKKWWEEESTGFDIWISEEVIAELSVGDFPRRDQILAFVAQLPVLPPDEQVLEIAQIYLDNYVMPQVLKGDALHIGLCHVLPVRLPTDLELQSLGKCKQTPAYPHHQCAFEFFHPGNHHAVRIVHGAKL